MDSTVKKPVLYVHQALPNFRLVYAPVERTGLLQQAPGQNTDGYGRRIHSDYLLDPGDGSRRKRVLIAQFSNAGTAYIERADGEWLCLMDGDFPDRIRHGQGNRALAKWLLTLRLKEPDTFGSLKEMTRLCETAETDGEMTIDRYFVIYMTSAMKSASLHPKRKATLHWFTVGTLDELNLRISSLESAVAKDGSVVIYRVYDSERRIAITPICTYTWIDVT